MVRLYVIENPQHPLEPAGSSDRGAGVVRTVSYAGGIKFVAWDYTNDKHAEEW